MSTPRVVLIAENVVLDRQAQSNPFAEQREMADTKYVADVVGGFEAEGVSVIHYSSPEELADNAHNHEADIVFSLWAGARLPSRLLLTSSICDAYGIKYFGPDAISRALCVEKSTAKHVARRHRFKTAQEIIAYRYQGLLKSIDLRPPVIVKPMSEGSSLGIHARSVCASVAEVIQNVERLWDKGYDPVLIEEFIAGKEAIAYIAGNKSRYYCRSYENYLSGNEAAFEDQPFSPDLLTSIADVDRRPLEKSVTEDLEGKTLSLFKSFSRMQLFAINGRLDRMGNFVFVEMNGFPSLKRGTAAYQMFEETGRSYGAFLVTLLDLALEDYRVPGFGVLERSDDIFHRL